MTEVGIAIKHSAYDHYIEDGPLDEQFGIEDQESILEGHQEHYETVERIVSGLEDAGYETQISYVPDEDPDALEDPDYAISVGGDQTVMETAAHLDETPLAAVRSTGTSTGGLCQFPRDQYGQVIAELEELSVEDWTRVDGKLDGEAFTALNELYVGAHGSQKVTDVHYDDGTGEDRHRGSGLVIATPAGRSGWYDNILDSQHMGEEIEIESPDPTEERLYYIGREPLSPELAAQGELDGDAEMTVRSRMNDNIDGIVSADGSDGARKTGFRRGEELTITVSETPLRMLVPDE